jgi:hypothetical protein
MKSISWAWLAQSVKWLARTLLRFLWIPLFATALSRLNLGTFQATYQSIPDSIKAGMWAEDSSLSNTRGRLP